MFPRNSGPVDSSLGNKSAFQMQDSNLPVAQSAGEQSTSSEQSTAPSASGATNNVSNTNNAQSIVSAVEAVGPMDPEAGTEVQDKRRLIQLQLVMLLHAYKCRINELETNGKLRQCSTPNCSTMKQVLAHMITCQAGKSCTFPHCSSSSQIISHWKKCFRSDCPVCVPLYQIARILNQHAAASSVAVQSNQFIQYYPPAVLERAYAALGLPYKSGLDGGNADMLQGSQGSNVPNDRGPHCSTQNMSNVRALQPTQEQNMQQQNQLYLKPIMQQNVIPSSSAQNFLMNYNNSQTNLNSANVGLLNPQNQVITGIMNDSAGNYEDWRQSVGQDLRQLLVKKIVQTIFPTTDANTYRDARMINLVAYVDKVENEMYKSANTREEYYQLLAEKTYKILKELEERRQSAKEQGQLQQQEVGSFFDPMLSNNSGTASPKFTGAAQSNLPESSNSDIQQRMAPPNITVNYTNIGGRNSELFARNPLANSLNLNMNLALNQNQLNQNQERQNALNADNLQQQQLQQQLQQQFNSMNQSANSITILSGEQSSITFSPSDMSQFNSTLQKNHTQLTNLTMQQNQMQLQTSALQQNQMQMINSSVSQNHLQLTNSSLQQNNLEMTNSNLQQNQVQMTNSPMLPKHLQMTTSTLQSNNLQMTNSSLRQQNQQMQYAFNARQQMMSHHQQSRLMGQVNQEQLVFPQNIKAQIQMIIQNQQPNQMQQQQQQLQQQQHNNQIQQQNQLQQQQYQMQQQNQMQQFSSQQQLQSHWNQIAPPNQPGFSPQMFSNSQVTQSLTPRAPLDFQEPLSQQPSRPGSVPGPSPQTPSNSQIQQQVEQQKMQMSQQSAIGMEEIEDVQPQIIQEDSSSMNQINNTSTNTPLSSDEDTSSGKHLTLESKQFFDQES